MVRIARELEGAAHAEVRARIRRAREARKSWAAVGALLSLGPIAAEGPGTLWGAAGHFQVDLPEPDGRRSAPRSPR